MKKYFVVLLMIIQPVVFWLWDHLYELDLWIDDLQERKP